MEPHTSQLADRFPATKNLSFGRRQKKHIPFHRQATATDCGVACLTMVLDYHGRLVPQQEVRRVIGVGRDGATATGLIEAGRWFGLRGRTVSLELEALSNLPRGSILHWEFSHFVVFSEVEGDTVTILDPARGKRNVPMKRFRTAFTGVALVFEPSDDFQTGGAKPKTLWPLFTEVLSQTGLLSRIVTSSILIQLLSLATPVLTGALIDRVVPRQEYRLLVVLSVGALILVLFQGIAHFVRAHLALHLRARLDVHLTLRFLDHLVSLPYAFFQTRSTGDLMMRLNSNDAIRETITSGTISAVLDGAMVSIYLLLLLLVHPSMAAVVFALGIARVTVFLLFRHKQRSLMTESLEAQADSRSYQVEMLDGMESLKAMGLAHRSAEHWSGLFIDNLNVAIRRAKLDAIFDAILSMLQVASPAIILCFGTYLVLEEQLTLGMMLALNAMALGFLGPLSTLVSSGVQLVLLQSYLERINDVMESPPEQEGSTVSPAPKLTGRICMENVSFRYTPSGPQIVRNITMDVAPGSRVAIVGQSGSGKSTLLALLAGLYAPDSGRILFDENDIAGLDRDSVRRQLGTVNQHTHLFGSSIRSNIALANPNLPLDRVVRAAKLACVHDEIQKMPMGYETVLADRGLSLSGGQRQRISIARALATEPAILLLDEATSALDAIREENVIGALADLECTQIVIAHRLSTIRNADTILVMHEGELVERGKHEELLALGGTYSQLVRAQRD